MRSVPVDINTFMNNIVMPVGVDPVVVFETGEQRRDNKEVLKWKLMVLYQEPGRKKELVEIGFSAPQIPEGDANSTLVLQGLVARHWENTNAYGTSSGISLSADTVGFKPATARQAA